MKVGTGVLIGSTFLLEWKNGYFKKWFSSVGKISWKFYAKRFVLILILTAFTFLGDSPVRFWLAKETPFLNRLTEFGSLLGKGTNCWTFLAAVYLLSYVIPYLKRKIIFGAMEASFLTAALVTGLKFVFLRARPVTEIGPFSFFNWKGLIHDDSAFQSFPSGDVAVVAGAAFFLFLTVRRPPLVRWLFLFLPILTAVARIYLDRHWLSDCSFSLGIGFLLAHWVWARQNLAESLN